MVCRASRIVVIACEGIFNFFDETAHIGGCVLKFGV
jgi:hypothetical protein